MEIQPVVNEIVEPASPPEVDDIGESIATIAIDVETVTESEEHVKESEDDTEDSIATIVIDVETVTESEDEPEDSIATIAIDSDDEPEDLEPPFECPECYLVLAKRGWPHDCPMAFNDHLDC